MLTLLLAALLSQDPALQRALERRTDPSSRVELVGFRGPACRGQYFPEAVEANGRVAVRVRGPGCDGWGWATVRVTRLAAVATRAVRAGEPLDGAWTLQAVDVTRGRALLSALPAGARAARSLHAGEALIEEAVRVGPPPGTPVLVRVLLGGVAVEQQGTVVACPGPTACAVLPGGRRVAGRLEDGALLVLPEGGRL